MDLGKKTTARVFSRAGLLGNPSDGYGGQALATTLYDFAATVTVEPGDGFVIHPADQDGLRFPSLPAAAEAFEGGGCEDAVRLIRAATKRFFALAVDAGSGAVPAETGTRLRGGAHIRYETTIPRQVGCSGSSALIIAAIRALAVYFDVPIEPFALSEAALAAELEDLGIAAGPMDRVVQSYGGTMLMDLAAPRRPENYQRIPTPLLPPLFLAWSPDRTKSSGALHGPLRRRWEQGDPEVTLVVEKLRALVDEGVAVLEAKDHVRFGELMTQNFALRLQIFPVTDADRSMVELAASHGCPAKLAGSGGAIVGMIGEDTDPAELERALRGFGASYIRPTLEPPAA
ncbi:MAG: mevalonate kinase family protein [Longimicrobiales bacterium]